MIKEYFANYFLHMSDVTFDMRNNEMEVHQQARRAVAGHAGRHRRRHHDRRPPASAWRDYVRGRRAFCFTYGDGVGDVDITRDSSPFTRAHGKAGDGDRHQPPGRFGALDIEGNAGHTASRRSRRATAPGSTAASSCSRRSVLDYIDGDATVWEREPLERLAAEGQLAAYEHRGFWQPMDTLRDKTLLEELWASGKAPWKIWE